MKKVFLFFILTLVCGISTTLYAQVTPAGAGDKSLENRDVKGRSVELERVSRETDKEVKEAKKSSETKFAEIKEDFEKMQMVNEDIQKQMGSGEPSRKIVSESSATINTSALRLKSNLFPNAKEAKKKRDKNKPEETVAAAPADLKSMTDSLNTTIFDFTHSPFFSNPKYTPDDSAKAQSDLEKIINVSTAIGKQTAQTN